MINVLRALREKVNSRESDTTEQLSLWKINKIANRKSIESKSGSVKRYTKFINH